VRKLRSDAFVYANDVQKEVKKIILEDLKIKINKLPEENA
jgi:hypothetical protein